MSTTTDKIYNYEEMPPAGVWESIATELDSDKDIAPVITMQKKRSKRIYYSAAAAACAILIFSVILFKKHSNSKTGESFFSFSTSPDNKSQNSAYNNTDTSIKNNDHVFITVPTEDSNDNKIIKSKEDDKLIAQNTQPHGGPVEKKSKDIDEDKSDSSAGKYDTASIITRPTVKPGEFLTIAGAEGQSIKVSSKASLLIDSSDNKIPPKLIWNKKIAQWREIMKGNTLAPTPGNFLDIIELTKTLKDK